MVAAQRQCVIGSQQARRRRCAGDSAARPAGPRRPPAGWWRARPPPPYSRAMPRCGPLPLRPLAALPHAAHSARRGGRIALAAARPLRAARSPLTDYYTIYDIIVRICTFRGVLT
ncbi:uncharacterized protein LOC123880503 [Maniola jurtina]|uniref:uncharacterized protein LOC123880503 n=1 Tax=Maniola jurtina TaxID=191418 RepID=UPI001E68FC7B|nr:uncharacterized protein LOC123880503 [Maniola jurtina]